MSEPPPTPRSRPRAGSGSGSGSRDPHHAGQSGVRSGAHRPSRPAWHGILPIALAVVLIVAVAYTAYQFKDSIFGNSSTSSSNAPLPTDDDNGPSGTATSTSTHTATHTKTSTATQTQTQSPTQSPSKTSAPPTVNKNQPVKVYNATSIPNLASGAAAKLKTAGWNTSVGGNERRFSPPGTTVYYGSAALQATAKAVAKDLGGYRVHLTATYGASAVSVVLASDYQH